MRKVIILILTLVLFSAIFVAITYLESLKSPSGEKPSTQMTSDKINKKNIKDSTDKLLQTVATRPTLSPKDLVAKGQLIGTLKNKKGIAITTKNYTIEYIESADSFMAEIKNPNIDLAKQEVINYFRSKGLTNSGICSLPLVFYLSPEAAREYSLKNEKFSPIADFCK